MEELDKTLDIVGKQKAPLRQPFHSIEIGHSKFLQLFSQQHQHRLILSQSRYQFRNCLHLY